MSATSETLRLIQSTSAQLCQNIVSPADPTPGVPDAHAAHRLTLLTAAWGPDDQPLLATALPSYAAGLPRCVNTDLSGLDADCVFPPAVGRIVLNLLILAADSLPSGGTVMLAGSADDLFLRIDGPAAAWPPRMAVCLVNEAAAHEAISAQDRVQMPLTALLAHAAGIRLSVLMPPSGQARAVILRLGGG